MAVDLHIHSTVSDGTLTPQQIVRIAREKGLTAIAIADHDAVAGIPLAIKAAASSDLTVLPAVEISTEYHGTEVHILGYFINTEAASLVERLQRIREGRRYRAQQIVEKLNDVGVLTTFEQVTAQAAGDSIGRPHVAAALVKAGYVKNAQEAFARYLRPGRPGYVPRYRLKPSEAIEEIVASGGLAVLAHPAIDNAEKWLGELMESDLGGLEAYHIHHAPGQTRHFLQLAEQLSLLVTGGTDSHGPKGPTPVEIGSVLVPDECVQRLLEWAEQHQRVVGRHTPFTAS